MIERWSYREFINKSRLLTGLDLDSYKERQMERRIRQWMTRRKYAGFEDLYAFLENDEDEKLQFINYITINTSEFFRDSPVFDYLSIRVLPDLLDNYHQLNIWSAACSTGEEPYSMNIIAHELQAGNRVKILAGDIDHCALNTARAGKYSSRQVEKVPQNYRDKYFERNNGCFYIREFLKKSICFQQYNLLALGEKHVYSYPVHLILCRNVFIYFKFEIQKRLIEYFSRLLPSGGYFITGSVEMVNDPGMYDLEKQITAVYKKVND